MYKIRLYVVPEQEEISEQDDVDAIDLSPSLMQRRNSRRPGAVRVNVIQKERRSHEKIRQVRQEIEKSNRAISQTVDLNKSPRKREQSNDEETKDETDRNNESGKENDVGFSPDEESVSKNQGNNENVIKSKKLPPPVPFRVSSLPQRSVFASPRIRELALNLQEKMLERSVSSSEIRENSINDKIASSIPIPSNPVVRSATSASRFQRFDRERVSLTRSTSAACKRSTRDSAIRKSGRKDQSGRSPKIVRVKNDPDTNQSDKAAVNSVILRRNKLNGYKVSFSPSNAEKCHENFCQLRQSWRHHVSKIFKCLLKTTIPFSLSNSTNIFLSIKLKRR